MDQLADKLKEERVRRVVEQTAGYVDRCEAEAGHLVIFDRRTDRRWADKVFHDRRTADRGVQIDVWGM